MRKDPSAHAFAARLVASMKERGFLGSGASGVDIAALAKAADISYEMARRYCAGLAVPRSEKLGIIAKWLDASPSLV